MMSRLKPTLLALDNDDTVLRQIARVLAGQFHVLQVRQPLRAIGMLEAQRDIRVFITEQVMSTADGVELLETARTLRPDVRRIMLTTYTDLAAIVGGLHSGAVERLVQKPVSDAELLAVVCPELRQATVAARASA
jgi:DNA-binding NtrC family response regulator